MKFDGQPAAISQTPSLSLQALAGGVGAVRAAPTTLVAEGALASWANGVAVDAQQLTSTLATSPYVAATVVLLGVPVALVLETITRRLHAATRIGVFAGVGFGAGLATSWIFLGGSSLLFAWPAVTAAVAGRATAPAIAQRPPVLVVLAALVTALILLPLLPG